MHGAGQGQGQQTGRFNSRGHFCRGQVRLCYHGLKLLKTAGWKETPLDPAVIARAKRADKAAGRGEGPGGRQIIDAARGLNPKRH